MYPSLQNAPTDCTSTSWVFDTLEVHVPYGSSDVGVPQPPLGAGLDALVTEPDGIGFDTELEKELIRRVGRVAEDSHRVSVPSEVKVLAQRVEELLRTISSRYSYYDAFPYKVKSTAVEPRGDVPGGGRGSDEEPKRIFPLSVVDWAVREQIDYEDSRADWLIIERDKARKEIRDSLLEAASVAWCVLYGINQVKSLEASKAAAPQGGRGLPLGLDTTPFRGPTIGIPGGQRDQGTGPTGGGDGDGYVPPIGFTPEPLTPGEPDDAVPGGTPTGGTTTPPARRRGLGTAVAVLGLAGVGYLIYRSVQ